MLGKLVLIAIQAVAALMGAPFVMQHLPSSGDSRPLIQAVVFAVIVWVVGLVGSFALKDVNMPSPRALAAAIVGGLIVIAAGDEPYPTEGAGNDVPDHRGDRRVFREAVGFCAGPMGSDQAQHNGSDEAKGEDRCGPVQSLT